MNTHRNERRSVVHSRIEPTNVECRSGGMTRTIDDDDKSTGNDDAKRALIGIRAKLAGQCAEGRSLPLEVAAQVDFLLKYASAPENLAVMYQGWSSWV